MSSEERIERAKVRIREILNDKWTFLAIGVFLAAAYYNLPAVERRLIGSYEECLLHYVPEAKSNKVANLIEEACFELYGKKP